MQRTHIIVPNTEKVWTTLGPEFGADEVTRAILVWTLYGLKSAKAAFRAHLVDMVSVIGYTPCMVDQDFWMNPEVKPMTSENSGLI